MGIFGSGDEPERIVQANGDSVTKDRLFEKSGRVAKRLCDQPIVEYLGSDEQPHHIFVGQKTGFEIQTPPSEQVSPTTNYHAFFVVSNQRILVLIGRSSGDETVELRFDEIVDISLSETPLKYEIELKTRQLNCRFPALKKMDSDEARKAIEFIRERTPTEEGNVEPPDDPLLSGTGGSDASEMNGDSGPATNRLAAEIASDADGEAVTERFLLNEEYLNGDPLASYFDCDDHPQHLVTGGGERELLIATNERLLLFTVRSKAALPKCERLDPDIVGDRVVISFDTNSITDIEHSDGRLIKSIRWQYDDAEYKIPVDQESTTAEALVNHVATELDHSTPSSRAQKMAENAENDTVTVERLREYEDLVLDELEDEQPHYVLKGNSNYGIKIEGGSNVDDQSVGLTNPGKTLQIKNIRTVLTDRRAILMLRKRTGHVNTWYVDYDAVTGVDFKAKITGQPLVIHTQGRTYYADISREASVSEEDRVMREAVEFVRKKAASASDGNSDETSGSPSSIEKLERLTALHEEGSLTDEEFEEKKTSLLDEI